MGRTIGRVCVVLAVVLMALLLWARAAALWAASRGAHP